MTDRPPVHEFCFNFVHAGGTVIKSTPDIGADENLNPPVYYSFSGTYSINGTNPTDWPAGRNFISFADAQSALEDNYLTGPVVFEVYDDAGDFTETIGGSIGFKRIEGVSEMNTLIFREADGENVVIDGSNYCIYVYDNRSGSDTEYMTFDGFTLTSFNQYGVYIYDADHITISNMDITVSSSGDHGIYLRGSTDDYCDSPLIYNNMIHGYMASGIYLLYTPGAEVYFNSIYNTYSSNGYGIYCDSPNMTDVPAAIMNNAVDNDGSDNYTAIYISKMSELPASMDYNIWFDRDTFFGKIWGVTYSSITTWRTDTGLDTHSFTADPAFISTSNLHIDTSSPCMAAGAHISSITTDFDGETRDIPPEIGADEYFHATPTPTNTPVGTWYSPTPTPTHEPVPALQRNNTFILLLLVMVSMLVPLIKKFKDTQG